MTAPLDKLTTILSTHMGKEPSDPDVLKAVVEVVMVMREPSDAMLEAASSICSLRVVWEVMIDALLTEGEG